MNEIGVLRAGRALGLTGKAMNLTKTASSRLRFGGAAGSWVKLVSQGLVGRWA